MYVEIGIQAKYYRTSFSPTVPPFTARFSRVVANGGTWRSHDWTLALAKSGLQGCMLMNECITVRNLLIKLYRIYVYYTNITLYYVIYSVRYYPRFHVTALVLGTYYPRIPLWVSTFYRRKKWL